MNSYCEYGLDYGIYNNILWINQGKVIVNGVEIYLNEPKYVEVSGAGFVHISQDGTISFDTVILYNKLPLYAVEYDGMMYIRRDLRKIRPYTRSTIYLYYQRNLSTTGVMNLDFREVQGESRRVYNDAFGEFGDTFGGKAGLIFTRPSIVSIYTISRYGSNRIYAVLTKYLDKMEEQEVVIEDTIDIGTNLLLSPNIIEFFIDCKTTGEDGILLAVDITRF